MEFKDMHISGKRRKIGLFFYLTAAAVLFLFWLFPEDAVRDFVERSAERIHPHITIGIGEVGPLFPPGVKFKEVSVSYKGVPVAVPDYIRVTPRLLSLFGEAPAFSAKSGVFGGIVYGNGRLMGNRGVNADVRMSGLKLEGINFLSTISEHRITGLMDGSLKVTSDGTDLQADSDMLFSDITVALSMPVLGMQTIQFDTVEAGLSITPRRIEIKNCTMKGQEVDGEFTGNIIVREPYKKSILNLTGFLKPQASFIKKAGKTLPIDLLMKKEAGSKGFPMKLTGTFQDPEIGLR